MRPTVIGPPAEAGLTPWADAQELVTSGWASIVNLPKEGLNVKRIGEQISRRRWTRRDLNPGPLPCKGSDLPLIYAPRWFGGARNSVRLYERFEPAVAAQMDIGACFTPSTLSNSAVLSWPSARFCFV